MVAFHTSLKFVVGHVLAGAVVIFGTLLVTLVCYIIGLATAPDGIDTPVAVIPEFLGLMFMAGFFAVMISTVSFVISVLLTWLRSKWPFPVWFPILAIPILTFVIVLLVSRPTDLSLVALVTGAAFIYFSIYWTLLTSSGAALDYFRIKFSNQKTI
jgi:hypothetical protein